MTFECKYVGGKSVFSDVFNALSITVFSALTVILVIRFLNGVSICQILRAADRYFTAA